MTKRKPSETRKIFPGRHLLADFFGVHPSRLRNKSKLMGALRSALKKEGFRVIRRAGCHQFEGGGRGVTGFFLLAQSHAAFHTYPEYGHVAMDIYSCGIRNPDSVVEAMRKFLKPARIARKSHRRG